MVCEPALPRTRTTKLLLPDTNVIVHAWNTYSPHHQQAKRLRNAAASGEIQACLCPQVLLEFFAVVTDGRRIERPISPSQAVDRLREYETSREIRKIFPGARTVRNLLILVEKYGIARQGVFDAFLVATMLDNGVQFICTEDEGDFARYEEISVFNPFRGEATRG